MTPHYYDDYDDEWYDREAQIETLEEIADQHNSTVYDQEEALYNFHVALTECCE